MPKTLADRSFNRALLLTLHTEWAGSKDEQGSYQRAVLASQALPENCRRDISRITKGDLKALIVHWRTELGNSPATINRKLSSLRVVLECARDHDWIDDVPDFPRCREPRGRVRVVEEEELLALEVRLKYPFGAIVRVLYDTGARLGEILGGNWGFTSGKRLLIRDTKNGEDREVPLTDEAFGILRNLAGTGDLPSASQFHKDWSRVRREMGLEGDAEFVAHALRHTCATRLVRAGVSLPVIQRWMGHRSISTTMRYVHTDPEDLEEALERLKAL